RITLEPGSTSKRSACAMNRVLAITTGTDCSQVFLQPGNARSNSGLGPLVDDALRFSDRALDASRGGQHHRGRNTDVALDALLERPGGSLSGRVGALRELGAHLDVERQLVKIGRTRDLEQIMRRELGLLQ